MEVLPRQGDREVRAGQVVRKGELGPQVALTPAGDREVDGQHDGPEPRLGDGREQLLREAAVA